MIIDFRIFEKHISKKEKILNNLLDKINKQGKKSLTSNELDFLNNYSSKDALKYLKNKNVLKTFKDENFQFELSDIEYNNITNDLILYGYMFFISTSENNYKYKIKGYMLMNQTTGTIFPYFSEDENKNAYDYCENYQYEFDNFINSIYQEITENNY